MLLTKVTTKFSFILLIILSCSILKEVNCQTYVTDCNDPFIAGHTGGQHSYCSHACRINGVMRGQPDSCTAAGMCLCSEPCYNGAVPPPPLTPLMNDYCPIANIPTPNPTDEAMCRASCATACPGGFGGELCKENEAPDAATTRYRICTCLCPAQPCNPPVIPTGPPVPTIPPATTTTTPPPVIPLPMVTPIDIDIPLLDVSPVLITIPYFAKLFFTKLIILCKKFYILWWIVFKIYVLQVVIAFCLKEVVSNYYGVNFDIDFADIYRILRYTVRYL